MLYNGNVTTLWESQAPGTWYFLRVVVLVVLVTVVTSVTIVPKSSGSDSAACCDGFGMGPTLTGVNFHSCQSESFWSTDIT